jgi:hypothetical protein
MLSFELKNSTFTNIWNIDRYYAFEDEAFMAIIAYFKNFYGDLVIGDDTTYSRITEIVGMFNSDTVSNLNFIPTTSANLYDSKVFLGFCSPLFYVDENDLTSLTV